MAEIRPFRGVRYRVPPAELASVLAPPYDVIPPAYRDALYARDPRNVVRAILNRTPGDAGYAEAGETYRRWLADGVLAPDPEDALYVLEQSFAHDGITQRRVGLLARFRAEDAGTRVILPHEQTRAAAKEDRWRVLLSTRANFSPIFLMLPDAAGRFAARLDAVRTAAPEVETPDDQGVGHRLWRVVDREAIRAFQALLAERRAYIADGHHRHATALRYRDERGAEGAWTFGYFTAVEDPGLMVLPYHRIVATGPSPEEARAALRGAFRLTEVPDAAALARAAAASRARYAFGLAWSGESLLAEAESDASAWLPGDHAPSLRALDTYFIHKAVLPRLGIRDDAVEYVHSLHEAEQAVSERRCHLALLLRGTPVAQILDVADAGESMPAKSTFFYPKLPSGLVIHPLAV